MARSQSAVAEQFDSAEQQRGAAIFGMWVFLATEVMLFGGLVLGLTVYRLTYHDAFVEGSRQLEVALGGPNTAVLIVSRLMVALAVHSVQHGHRKRLVAFLLATALLGLVFLGIKAVEYYHHWVHGAVPGLRFEYTGPHAQQIELFFVFYFVMTGLHALHVTIGIGIITVRHAPSGHHRE